MKVLYVGLFSFFSFIVFIVIILSLTQENSFFESYKQHYTIIDDAIGLIAKSPIKIAGLDVGKIEKITLDQGKAKIFIKIKKSIFLPKDSSIHIKTSGVLGDKYLEISLGKDSQPLLKNAAIQTDKISNDLYSSGESLVVDLKDMIKTVKEQFLGAQGEILKEMTSKIKSILTNIDDTSKIVSKISTNNELKFHHLISNLSMFSEKLAHLNLKSLETFSENMTILSTNLKEGKGSLGKLLTDEELVNKATETLNSINTFTKKFTSSAAEIDIFSAYNKMQGSYFRFNLDIVPGPEKFFRIGLSSADYGPYSLSEKRTLRNKNGVHTDLFETYHNYPTYRINAQLGRKILNLSLRVGLIDSAGGFGIDYIVPNIGLKTTVDVFNWSKDTSKPTVRASGELKIWNIFYLKGVGENMLDFKKSGMSYGAGIRLDDNDVASFINLFK
jgi:phospholipid/cholesterol/gamma-HCH transport system substrate-binding protein